MNCGKNEEEKEQINGEKKQHKEKTQLYNKEKKNKVINTKDE